MADPRLKTYAPQAVRHLAAAGHVLADRQDTAAGRRGNVPAWPGSDDVDFHGTLSAIWVWARHQRLSGANRYQGQRTQAWTFVETNAKRFIPDAIDNTAGDETAYDCAMMLMATAAERALGERTRNVSPSPTRRRACSPITWACWRTFRAVNSAILVFWPSRWPNMRGPWTTGACWPARASSSIVLSA